VNDAAHDGAAHVAFDVFDRFGPCDIQDFRGSIDTPHDRYVRFTPAVAGSGATHASTDGR
jgi:hypothetical protein